MTALFGELIDVPQFLVNNALSSSDSSVIRRENMWLANEETGYRALIPHPQPWVLYWAKQEVILLHIYAMLCKKCLNQQN